MQFNRRILEFLFKRWRYTTHAQCNKNTTAGELVLSASNYTFSSKDRHEATIVDMNRVSHGYPLPPLIM